MEFKGTKEKWNYSKKNECITSELKVLAEIYDDNMEFEEMDANGKLMAASKELLSVLIRIKEEHGISDPDIEEEMNQAIDKALK